MVSNSLLLLTWPKTPLSFVVKRRGKTPLLRIKSSMANTSRFWPVSMSYFCAYLGCTRTRPTSCRRMRLSALRSSSVRGRTKIIVHFPPCVISSMEMVTHSGKKCSELFETYLVPPPVVAPPLPSPIVPPSAGPEPVGDEGIGRSAVPSLAHPPAKSISPRLMAASDSRAVLPRMFRHVRVIDGLLRDSQKPWVRHRAPGSRRDRSLKARILAP
jgi:hypothetical protein